MRHITGTYELIGEREWVIGVEEDGERTERFVMSATTEETARYMAGAEARSIARDAIWFGSETETSVRRVYDEKCECAHSERLHTGDDEACTSPTTEWWERTYQTPCTCSGFRFPDVH